MNRNLRCFVSASFTDDLRMLRSILLNLGVKVQDAYDMPVNYSNSFEDEVTKKIKEVDFVIAIVKDMSPNLFYEIGLSRGLGKPIFLIKDKDIDLPYNLKNQTFINSSVKDEKLLEASLTEFIKQIPKIKKNINYIGKGDKNKSSELKNGSLLQKIASFRENGTGKEFEQFVVEVFKDLNVQVVSNEFSDNDTGVDLAIWLDELESSIGNPIFTELKYGNLDRNKILDAEMQLQRYVINTGAKAGILLYLDRHNRRFEGNFTISPFIFRFDFEDFLKGLTNNSLPQLILEMRNSMVHGGIE